MIDVLQDLSTLTLAGRYNYDNLTDLAVAIFSHGIEESVRDNSKFTSFNIGIGTITIKREDNEISYKFIPSKKLDEQIVATCRDRKSAIELKVDKALGERIVNTYKDLF